MNKEALSRAQQALKISSLYLRRSLIELHEDFEPGVRKQKLEVQLKSRPLAHKIIRPPEEAKEPNLLSFDVEFAVRFILLDPSHLVRERPDEEAQSVDTDSQQDKPVIACEMAATYSAMYQCTAEIPDLEALQEFGRLNAVYHLWPYWREYLHSTCSRIGIEPITLPMMMMQGKAAPAEVQAPRAPTASEKDVTPPKEEKVAAKATPPAKGKKKKI